MPIPPDHPLDWPIWNALTSRQRDIAMGGTLARRYPPPTAPFAAVLEPSADGYEALSQLIGAGDRVALFTLEPVSPGEHLIIQFAKPVKQMIWNQTVFPRSPDAVPLGEGDVPAMQELVELTKPGPFGPKTHKLGKFFGVWVEGQLAAMAGERMKLDGFTEITVVCVHPSFRGRGYGDQVMRAVAREIVSRSEQPFLHVFADNAPALTLYHRVGLTIRQDFLATALTRKQ